MSLDVERLRQDFPCLDQEVRGKPLVYFDNAASAQTPLPVVDAITHYYLHDRANIHRGVHELSQRATESYDAVRPKVAHFLGVADARQIIFVRGTSEGINLVASTFGKARLGPGDVVLVSSMEHHSNIVPWQLAAAERGATVQAVPFNDQGELDLVAYEALLGPRVKMVSLVHVSNALGTINPAKRIVEMAHAHGIPVMLDGAQAVPHMHVDLDELDVDFYTFSAHKLFGPTGVGVLYGKAEHLQAMTPYQGGGDMIERVTIEGSTWAEIPHKFEAGTPNIAGVIGLGAAIDYVEAVGIDNIAAQEADLLAYATERLANVPGIRPIGTASQKASVYSFVIEGVHTQDIGTMLDMHGIAVRTGHHCAQPVMERMGVTSTVRASFAFYNTRAEIDRLATALVEIVGMFGVA